MVGTRPPHGHPRPSTPRPHLLPHQDPLLNAGSVHLGLLAPHLLPQHLGLRLGALQRAPQLRDLPIQPLRREEMLRGGPLAPPGPPPTRPRTHRHLPALVDEIHHMLLLLFQDVLQHLLVLQGTKWGGREGVVSDLALSPRPRGTGLLTFEVIRARSARGAARCRSPRFPVS